MMHVRSYHLSRRFCDLLLASSGTLNLQPPSTKVSTLAASLGGHLALTSAFGSIRGVENYY
jgi:hypothetical protein